MENNTNKICGDGSFMERFLKQKYSHKQKSTTIHTLSNEKKEETKIPTSPVLSKEEEDKLKQELIQKQMDEIEEETRNRELMVKQLLNTQKEQKEKPDLPKNIPKARKQPFVSSSTPKVITGKRPTSTRSKPVMPVTKKQRVAIFLPRNRVPTAKIEIPKPPPLLIKKKIDSFANLVVEKGLNYEEEAMKENDRSYLFVIPNSFDLLFFLYHILIYYYTISGFYTIKNQKNINIMNILKKNYVKKEELF